MERGFAEVTSTGSKKLDEVARLAEWCVFAERAVFGLYSQHGAISDFIKEFFEESIGIIQRARERGDLRGLRMVYRDLNEKFGGLDPQMRDELDRLLRAQFGHGLEKGERALERQARRILKLGRIRRAEDYRVLETRLHVILDDASKLEEVDQINELLATVKAPLPE